MTAARNPDGDDLAEFGYSQSLDHSIGKLASFAAGIGDERADLIEQAR